MPIYAYRCATCGHAQDVLQRMSDPLLTVCPACGAATYEKQVTAAGFQLKGSGWYVTDFRNGNSGAPAKKDGDAKEGESKDAPAAAPAEGGGQAASTDAGAAASGASPGASQGAGAAGPKTAESAKPATKPAAPPATPAAGT
jgi:putative FmdB family regulatory protein